jgi:hypothetical protein
VAIRNILLDTNGYKAPDTEAIREAARRLNVPVDTIIEIGNEIRPEMFGVQG